MNLHDVIHTLESLAEKDKAYFYGKDIGAHLRKVERIFTYFFHKMIWSSLKMSYVFEGTSLTYIFPIIWLQIG